MAEFVQTMKDWRRMCNTIKSCDDCPMYKEDGWTYVLCSEGSISSSRPEVAEKVIVKWAAEHPEPVYPTWYIWLTMIGAVTSSDDLWMDLQQPIPADIAQKHRIEPKEG